MATTNELQRRREHRSTIRTCQRLALVAERHQRAPPREERKKLPRESAEKLSQAKVFYSTTSSQLLRVEARITTLGKRAQTSLQKNNLQPNRQLSWPLKTSRIRSRSSTKCHLRRKKESHKTSSTRASSRPTQLCRPSRTRFSKCNSSSTTCSCSRCWSACPLSSSRSSWSSLAMSSRSSC